MPRGERIDRLLVERGLAETRERAQALVMEGLVYADGQRVPKPASSVKPEATIEVRGKLPYVSRGGIKLAHALQRFQLSVTGQVALDVGASTGGFTDCLLQHGAARVYALDVGRGQLDYSLRQDPRVKVIERINARYPFSLPEEVDIVTIDVSFISLTKVLPSVVSHVKRGSLILCLVKPQFEAKRREVGRGGVVRDPLVHAAVLGRITAWCIRNGFRVRDLTPSPITGDAGNREFFLLLQGYL